MTGSGVRLTQSPARRVNVANVSVNTSKVAVSLCCVDWLCTVLTCCRPRALKRGIAARGEGRMNDYLQTGTTSGLE